MKKRLLIAFVLISTSLISQDPSFSMGAENQSYINPAFCGTAENMRLGMSYRNQWPQINGNYITTNAYFDKYMGKYGGVGIKFIHDVAGNVLSTDNLYLDYAYHLKVKQTGVLSFGVEFGFFRKSLDWDKLTFGDQIDPRRGFVYQTNDVSNKGTIYNLDFGAGLLFHNELFFVSFATHHINMPNQSLVSGVSRLPMMYNTFAGIKWNMNELNIMPIIDLKWQDLSSSYTGWLMGEYKHIQLGVGVRTYDAVLISGGVVFESFRLKYCYDATTSKLNTTGGSHEIGLQLFLKGKNQNDRYFSLY